MRNPNVDGDKYVVISGASADTTVKATGGTLAKVHIWAVGAASSKIELYDGTAAAGTKIGEILGTAVTRPGDCDFQFYCATSIHAKTTDSGGAMRITVTFR